MLFSVPEMRDFIIDNGSCMGSQPEQQCVFGMLSCIFESMKQSPKEETHGGAHHRFLDGWRFPEPAHPAGLT